MAPARLLVLAVASLSAMASAEPAPAFDKKGLDGKQYVLSQLSGKVVVLNFWFKSCGPCIAEMGDLNRVVDTYKSAKDVVFLGFSTDGAAELGPFLKEHPFQYTVIPDSDDVAAAYDVHGFPTHVLIDRQGQIAARWSGGRDALYRLTTAIAAVRQGVKVPEPRPSVTSAPRSGRSEPPSAISITPEQPRRGDRVKLSYAVRGDDRRDSFGHEVYASWDIHADDAFSSGYAPMRREGKAFVHELEVPANATAIHVRFTSRAHSEGDERTLPILGTDGKPLRNAFADIGACNTDIPFERELENYPDSPFALLRQLEARAEKSETFEEAMRQSLPDFEKAARGNALERSAAKAELLLAAADFDGALQLAQEMVARDRNAFFTRRTLAYVLMDADDSKKLPSKVARSFWRTLATKDDVWSREAAAAADDAVLDAASAEKICAAWISAEPDNPLAHGCLARVRAYQGRLDEALRVNRTALDWMSAGRLGVYLLGRLGGTFHDEVELWERQAELALRQKRYPEALAAAEAALAAQQRAEREPYPETYALLGRIAEAMGRLDLAEEAWRASVRAGSGDLEPLKRVYQRRHGSLQGFQPPLPDDPEPEPTPALSKASQEGGTGSQGNKALPQPEGPPISQYPPELRALLERLEKEGRASLAQRLRGELAWEWGHTQRNADGMRTLVIGRVLLEDSRDRVTHVDAQMRILEGGYFVTAVRDLQRPIGFAMHGYEPYELATAGLPRQPIIWAGEFTMRKTRPERRARLSGKLVLPPDLDPTEAKVALRSDTRTINTPTNGTAPRSEWAPPTEVPVRPDGSFSADGFSPGSYYMVLSHPELVRRGETLTFKPGETLEVGAILMERPQSIDASFIVAEKPPFTGQQIHQEVVKGGEKWWLRPGVRGSSLELPRLALEQELGVLKFVSRYGPCWLVDLGKGPLDRHVRIEEKALPSKQSYEVEIQDDHVYLLKQDDFQWALIHVRVRK